MRYYRGWWFCLPVLLLAACAPHKQPLSLDSLLHANQGPKVPTMKDTLQEEAEKAFHGHHYRHAAQLYWQLWEQHPKETAFLLGYAEALRLDGKTTAAREAYEKLLAVEPASLDALEGKGLSYLVEGMFPEAVEQFNRVLKRDAARWRSVNAIGVALALTGRAEEAIQYYEAALDLNPRNTAALNNLGLVQALEGRYEEAIRHLRKASASASQDAAKRRRVDLNLALVYGIAGQTDQAEQAAAPYLSHPALANNLGFYAKLAKDRPLARAYLSEALSASATYYKKAWENLQDLEAP